MRPVDAQIAGILIDLILHQIEGRDLDVGIELFGWLRTDRQAMPRVRAKLADLRGVSFRRLSVYGPNFLIGHVADWWCCN